MRYRLTGSLLLAAFLAISLAPEANAGPTQTRASLERVVRVASAEGLSADLEAIAATPAIPSLPNALGVALKPAERGLLKLARRAHGADSGSDRRRSLRLFVRELGRNPAIVALRQRGEQLGARPALLRAEWKRLTHGFRRKILPGGAETPIGRAEATVHRPLGVLGGKSFTTATAALLSTGSGFRFVRGLPPIALGILLSSGSGPRAWAHAPSPRAAVSSGSVCASGSIYPSVETMLRFVANSVLTREIDGLATEAGKKLTLEAVYKLASFGFKALSYRAAKRFLATVDLALGLKDGIEMGKGAVDAAWNAVVKCSAKEIAIVPANMVRAAGETQSYSLLARDKHGRSWGGIRPDMLTLSHGTCNAVEESCTGTSVGTGVVTALFGALEAQTTLTVTPGPIANLALEPGGAKIELGESSPPYRITATDRFGNPVATSFGDGDGQVHLSVDPDGTCDQTKATCTPEESGAHHVSVEAVGDPSVRSTVPLDVWQELEIATFTLSPDIPGVYNSETLEAIGGEGARTWHIVSGELPPGVALSPATGTISGQPTVSSPAELPAILRPFEFEVAVEDGAGHSDTQELILQVEAPPCSGNPCAVANGFGQVTLAWESCGCAYWPSGPDYYEAAAYVNGIFVSFERFWDAMGIAPGERNWTTYVSAGSSQLQVGQSVRYTLYVYHPSTSEYVPIGTSNSVVVK